MYLVQFVCLRDRIPLFASHEKNFAVAYGRSLTGLDDPRVQAAAGVVDCISTKQVMVELVEFENFIPKSREILRDFWAEEHPPAEPEATGSDESDESDDSDDESEHAPTELEDAGMSNDA